MSFCTANNVVEPLAKWTPTIAPGDIVYYAHDAIPEWKDNILLAVLKEKKLVAIELNSAGTAVVKQTDYFKNTFNRLRDIAIAPDGTIYLATSGDSWSNTRPFTHRIVKVSPILTSISSTQAVNKAKLFPNPTSGNVEVEGDFTSLKLLNQNGVVVFETAEANFDISSLNKGIYIVKITSGDNVVTEKLIVE